jgi:hypothetical protein
MIKQEIDKINESKKKFTSLITGDLNMSEKEVEQHGMNKYLDIGTIENKSPTWPGDSFSSLISNKHASSAITLDYTFLSHPSSPLYSLTTKIVSSLFDHHKLDLVSLSDHCGLYSHVIEIMK